MSDTVNVAAGQTLSVASGQTVESLELINAGTVSNAGTVQADLIQRLDAAATDTDTATASLQRDRLLDAAATDTDTATATASVIGGAALIAVATDADTATATLQRNQPLTAAASDADTTIATVVRERELVSVATDTDTALATRVTRIRATAEATDSDRAIASRFALTDANDPIQVIVDLLELEAKSAYTTRKPTIKRYFDDAPAERGPGANQPPDIYVWSPTSATLDRHSMDDQQFDRQNTLQILIMSLDEPAVIDVANDVVGILSKRLQDNRDVTPFIDLAPTQVSDFRRQTSARDTDHFVTRVTVETKNLPDTGLTNR
jgi:hypothetical protein